MKASEVTLVFIHRNSRFPVNYASEHAALLGYRVVVIGEADWDFRGCENLRISDFDDRCEAFRNLYIHVSPNNPVYEAFCFQRWIILSNYMQEVGTRNVIYVDSDALVFDGIEELAEISGGKVFDTPYLNFFATVQSANLVVDEIFETFSDSDQHRQRVETGVTGIEYFTDMLLFPQIAKKFPNDSKRWARDMERYGFDSNINNAHGFEGYSADPRHGVKRITFDGTHPMGRTLEGEEIRFRFLHFQGFGKPLMRYYLAGAPEDYSNSWWPTPEKPILREAARKIEKGS